MEVGASPEDGVWETIAAGFGGAAATDDVGGFCAGAAGTDEVGGFWAAGVAGTEDVGGFAGMLDGAGVSRSEAVGGRTELVGGLGETGVAAESVCCGGRVSGICTGPDLRVGADSVVSRREPVGGRTLPVGFCGGTGIGCDGPNAGGSAPVEGRDDSGTGGADGLAGGVASVTRRTLPVGGRTLLVGVFGAAGIGCEGPNAGGSGPVEGRDVFSGIGGAACLADGSGSVGWREAGLLASKREVVGRGDVGSGAVGGFAPEIGGNGLVAGAREDVVGPETLAALGNGSVAGRAPALRGIICAEGIFPPGSGGSPPVGARDDARWPCGGREGIDPLGGRAGESGGMETAGGRAGGTCTCDVAVFTDPVAGFNCAGAPTEGSGVVGGRVAASRCICEVIAREIAADAGLGGLTEGSDRVAGREGAGSVVSRNCAVGGRAMFTGGFGASEAGLTFAGGCGTDGGTDPDAVGPSVRRICPVGARRGGTAAGFGAIGTWPVAGRGNEPDRGSSVTRGTDAVIGGFGASERSGGGGAASSGMGETWVLRNAGGKDRPRQDAEASDKSQINE